MSNIAVALLLFNIFNNFLNPYILTKGSKIYNSKEIFNNQSLFPIYFSILTAIISSIVLYFLFKVFKFDFEFYVNLVLAYYLLFLAIDLLKRVSQVSNNFKIYSTSLAIDKVIFLCLILFFFLFGYNLNAYNLLFLVNISCLFSILFIILILKRNLNLKFNGSFEVKEFYNFSKLTFVISLISSIYSYQFLIVIFSNIYNSEIAGFLSLSFSIIGILIIPFFWIEPILARKFSEKIKSQKFNENYINDLIISIIFIYSLVIFIFGIIILKTNIISLIFGSTFVNSKNFIYLILPITIFEGINILLIWFFYTLNLQKIIIFTAMIRAISILFSLIIIQNVYYLLSVYVIFAGLAIIIYLYKIKKFIIKSGYINYTAIFILTITYHYVYFFQLNIFFIIIMTFLLICIFLNYKKILQSIKFLKNEF